jgi:predicted alpha/beta superfamily hydrolase
MVLVIVLVGGCQPAEPEVTTVEVTRIVEVPERVEVTRVVELLEEIEVTRVVAVEVEGKPAAFSPLIPVEFETLASEATGRDYAITVALPLSYSMTEADYPVIYVTDGDVYTVPLAVAAGQLGFGQEIPEVIVVGVDYGTPNPMEWLELRELDMGADGSENFARFFEEELIPTIESKYRVDASNRTLAGHSSGGRFALDCFLSASGAFANYIASSPGNAATSVDALDAFVDRLGGSTSKLFLSAGEMDDPAIVEGVNEFGDVLEEMGIEGLSDETTILDGETHLSARPRAFNNALRWIFGG